MSALLVVLDKLWNQEETSSTGNQSVTSARSLKFIILLKSIRFLLLVILSAVNLSLYLIDLKFGFSLHGRFSQNKCLSDFLVSTRKLL